MPIVHDTIFEVLRIVQFNLESALNAIVADLGEPPADTDNVVIGNIAYADSTNGHQPSIQDRIVLTLVKTEEEFALKNQPAHRRNPVSGNLEYVNPPVFLNLYILVTANNTNYHNAILYLSRAIGYLQAQRVFTETNCLIPPSGVVMTRFNFNINMVSPTFEQINHIWGVLGGKQLPSSLYKLQLIEIQYEDQPRPGEIIRKIVLGEKIY